ncbi:sigma-54 interaction domain-containing protein [Desulfovirgula thermocuniculi]|uniref:sigma-54 interaction domain-containing protein n=1 Tax=Desulfovirgula thermocuniculi TaxID=348842 RepID=UPI00040A1707|nr:sigma-54-dependent Fis family transcriptional regulator [Desulfovirgula thermocuniculi]
MTAKYQVYTKNAFAERREHAWLFSNAELLRTIMNYSYDTILVTDGNGKVIFVNPAAEKSLGLSADQLMNKNVRDLVKEGVYDRSMVLESLETRSIATGIVKTRTGITLLVTSIPILDESGRVKIVITNGREANIIEKYLLELEKERARVHRYKAAVDFLSEADFDRDAPVAESPQMRQIIDICNIIAKTDSTVLITGESGTGKEVIARYIHKNSPRASEPFIPVNCAAIPRDLLESEFFGYTKGAFTGANAHGKPGLFEIADKGTLFLDEIGELPLAMQSKLLRVLDTGEVQRLGGTTFTKINVRVIAATNRDLKKMVEEKAFRGDLYYRLNVLPIHLPPLRERPEDILPLARRFLQELNKKYGLKKRMSPQLEKLLLSYDWPGNARELRNVIERLVITSREEELHLDEGMLERRVPEEREKAGGSAGGVYEPSWPQGTLRDFLKEMERRYISQVLRECNGRIGEAARRLGIHRTMLYRKLRGYG